VIAGERVERAMLIDGSWVGSASDEWIDVNNPATGELVARVPSGTVGDVDTAVRAARASFVDGRWRRLPIPARVAVLNRLADLMDANADRLAATETRRRNRLKLRRDSDRPSLPTTCVLRHGDPAPRGRRPRIQPRPHQHEPARPIGVVGLMAPELPAAEMGWQIGPALAPAIRSLQAARATPLTA